MPVTDAEVEAAARAMFLRCNPCLNPDIGWQTFEPDARAALEAAEKVREARQKAEAERIWRDLNASTQATPWPQRGAT